MSTQSFPYLHSTHLRQRYVDELDDALRGARLSAVECRWLQALIRPQHADDPDPVRVDRLIAANPLHRHAELSGALLLSHGLTTVSDIYLYTVGLGLEVFADRLSLLAGLRARYAAGDEAAIFEYEKIDGDAFEAQMLALVDHQAERVGTLTARLKQMPGWLEDSTGSAAETLAEVSRRHSTRLAWFWRTVEGASTPRDVAIEAFENSLRDRVYRREAAGLLTPESRNALCAVLHLLPGQGALDSHLRCYRLALRVGDSAACSLAGTFVVKPTAGAEGALLWYSPDHQWHRFADTVALTAYFATPEGKAQAACALAFPDHAVLQREGEVRIGFAELQTRPCVLLIDSILALQARNLMYALGLPQPSEKQAAMIDDALDIRQLLDPRQLCFSAGRWRRQAPFDFMAVWQRPAAPASATATFVHDERRPGATPLAEATAIVSVPSWRDLTRDFDRRTTELLQLDNTLKVHAEQALQRYLCVWSEKRLDASDVQIQWHRSALTNGSTPPTVETGDIETLDLMSLLLDRVTGRCGPELPASARVRVDNPTAPGHFPVALVEHLLHTLTPDFVEGYVHQFEASRREGQRHGDRPLQPEREALKLREDAMRLYAALATRQRWIDASAGDLIRQMLDQPTRASRAAAHPQAVEAFEVWLTYGDASSVMLCDAIVLQSPQQARSLVFWSCLTGWRSFGSGARLQRMLQRNLASADRDDWLQLLSERDRARLERHLAQTPDSAVRVRLDRIDGHALEVLQEGVLQRQLQDVRQLCLRARRGRFEAQVFSELAVHYETDASLCSLIDGLSVRIETSLFEALLPPWLSEASIADLGLYCDLLKRYYEATDGGKDFLIGVSSLHGYARAQLHAGLAADFPGQGYKPDDITITSRDFVSAFPPAGELPSGVPAATITHTESLTEYAINRFVNHQSAILSVTSEVYPQVAETMTVNDVRQLVRRLNVGAGYAALLREALTPTDALYELRNRLFVNQLPPMLMAVALAQKLKGELSPAAFDLVVGVLDMPDGLAREPIHGVRAMISPVRLVADAGMTPDLVSGVYLIGAGGDESGVHVLYAMHDPTFTFREYASLSALHEAIRTDASLQQLLLARVERGAHRRYNHGGFIEPHLPFSVEGLGDLPFRAPGPVTLDVSEVKGNAVQYLFNGAVKLLLELSVADTVTNEQEDQAGRTFLATLGFEQLVSLLPSKLSAMVTLWQSQTLLRASAASASGRHWGEAFSEFSAALGVMVTAREQSFQEQVRDDRLGGDGLTEEEEPLPSAFSWRNNTLDAGQIQRLKGLEARDVALADLRHDHLLNLFTDTVNGATYAVVTGRVYRVRRIEAENNWIIVGADGTTGPKLVMDINQRWHLDLTLGLRGGGAVVTKIKEGKVDKSAKDILVIEARGMPEIRELYRDRARRIGQAHLKAKRYLETCLDNLSPHQIGQPLDPQVTRIIADHFGVTVPKKALLDETLNTAKTLYSAIMDASLSPYSSQRFVIGSTRPGHEAVTAFVIKSDPKQRLYLTEQFFISPLFALTPAALAQGFSVDNHHRAANLIHELSHLTLDTHDIAYLESMAPYPDLLLADTPYNTRVRDSVGRLHTTELSHLSNRNVLFTLIDAGTRRDIEPQDGRGFETILKVTGTLDLEDARDVFLSDAAVRSRLIMRNADSVTLLMLLLGRRNFVVPSP